MTTQIQKILIGLGIVLVVIAGYAVFGAKAAQAQGKSAWTGCGVNLHGSQTTTAVNIVGPLDISATGQTLGISLLCDVQMGNAVVGGFVDYDRMFGNIVNPFSAGLTGSAPTEIVVGARAGLLPSSNALIYVHGGRSWSEFGGFLGTIEGWKYGAGAEIKLPAAAPLFLDIRYTHTDFDQDGLLAGVNAHADAVRLGLTFKFGPIGSAIPAPASYFAPEKSAPLK